MLLEVPSLAQHGKHDLLHRLFYFVDQGKGHIDLHAFFRLFGTDVNGDFGSTYFEWAVATLARGFELRGGGSCAWRSSAAPKTPPTRLDLAFDSPCPL